MEGEVRSIRGGSKREAFKKRAVYLEQERTLVSSSCY